jgi:hypothetical protein
MCSVATSLLPLLLSAAAPAPPPPAPPPTPEAEPQPAAAAPALVEGVTTTAVPEAAAAGVRRPIRVALYSLERAGIDPRLARIVEDSLLAELRKLQRASVLSMDEVKTLLDHEAQRQLMGCDEGSCLAEIAMALGADSLIIGGVTKVDNHVVVSLRRMEPQSASVVQSYNQQLTWADGEELLAAIGPAVEALFPELPLKAGQQRGVAPELALRLNPPPLPVWAIASTLGTTAVLAASTIVAGALWAFSDGELRASYATAATTPVPATQVVAQQQQVQVMNVAFWVLAGSMATAGIASGVMVPFTDWQGLREKEEP